MGISAFSLVQTPLLSEFGHSLNWPLDVVVAKDLSTFYSRVESSRLEGELYILLANGHLNIMPWIRFSIIMDYLRDT